MKKYNKDKRAAYKAHTRKNTYTYDGCGAYPHKRIHIRIRYDGYKRTQYDNGVRVYIRKNDAQRYVNIVNAINDIFPAINAPHTQHTHRAIAPYKRVILTEPTIPYAPPSDLNNTHSTYEDTRTAKCIIFNDKDEMIHYGWIRRTIHIDRYSKHHSEVHITLYKGNRSIDVRPYIPAAMKEIHGIPIQEIRKNGVEFYHI